MSSDNDLIPAHANRLPMEAPPAAPANAGEPGEDAPPASPLLQVHRLLRGRYWLAIVLAAVLGGAGAAAGYRLAVPTYESVGMIRIRPSVPRVLYDSEQNNVMPMFDAFVDSQASLLRSRRVVDLALRNDEWQALRPGMAPDDVAALEQGLNVENRRGTQILYVRYTAEEPDVAAAGAKAVIDAYVRLYGETDADEALRRLQLLEDRRTALNGEVKALRDQIVRLGSEYGTTSLDSHYQARVTEVQQVEAELLRTEVELALYERMSAAPEGAEGEGVAGAEAEAAAVGQEDAGAGAQEDAAGEGVEDAEQVDAYDAALFDPRVARLLARRDDVARQVRSLERQYGQRNPTVELAREEMADAQSELDAALARFREDQAEFIGAGGVGGAGGPGAEAVSAAKLSARRDNLRALLDRLRPEMLQTGRSNLEIANLHDDLAVVEERLATTKSRIEAINVEAPVSGRITVLSDGDRPVAPAVDKRKKMAGAGAAGGIGLGVAAVAGLGLLRRKIRYADEALTGPVGGGANGASKLPPTVLGVLPKLPAVFANGNGAVVNDAVEEAAHAVHHVRTLLQRRLLRGGGVLAVTSATPGSGKTSLTAALGMSFAGSGARTLVIDCDITGGQLTRRLPQVRGDALGLRRALAGADLDACVSTTSVPNLSVLPRADLRRGDAAMISHASLAGLLRRARSAYDVVLLDTGPLLGCLEAAVAAAEADAVVLVTSRGEQAGSVRQAAAVLTMHAANVAGVVFNRAAPNDFKSSIHYSQYASQPADAEQETAARAAEPDDWSLAAHLNGEALQMGPLALAVAATTRHDAAGAAQN